MRESLSKTSTTKGNKLPWVLLILCLSIAGYKASYLSYAIFDSLRLKECFRLLIADWQMIGPIFLLVSLAALFRKSIVVIISRLAALLLTLWYATDTFVLLDIGHKFSTEQLMKFLPEMDLLLSFIGPIHFVLVLLLLLSPFITLSTNKLLPSFLALISVIGITASAWTVSELPKSLSKYRASISDIFGEIDSLSSTIKYYSDEDISYYRSSTTKVGIANLPSEEINILTIVVEGLSSVDSYRTSGLSNNLPVLDELSKEGVLFKNFISNHSYSAGGLVALFQGVAPIPFPGSYPSIYRSFAKQGSILKQLEEKGYHTEVLQGTSSEMLFYREWSDFKVMSSGEDTPAFENTARFVMDAPSDKVILTEGLRRLKELELKNQPYLYAIQTSSMHPPFFHPETESTKEEDLIRYTDSLLGEFYNNLKETDFFENGLLIITGDHRKQSPITEKEWQLFGDSAPARVPLIIIGSGIAKNLIDDRLFQQSDLFPNLADISDSKLTLSEDAIFITWTGSRFKDTREGNLVFFDSKSGLEKGFPASVFGREFIWKEQPAPDWQKKEHYIHAIRAHLQAEIE